MSYVLVTADFPGVSSSERNAIYDCLRKNEWIKVDDFGRDISTVWYANFRSDVNDERAVQIAIEEFVDCSRPYCKAKLVIHCGPNKPALHGII